jgi:hypothetical protein
MRRTGVTAGERCRIMGGSLGIGSGIMQRFLQQHADRIVGVLMGFDRVLFRGSMLSISYTGGMDKCLASLGIRYCRFAKFVEGISKDIKQHAAKFAQEHGRPLIHLNSPTVSKEDLAREIAQRDGITEGLIAVFTCVESCQSFGFRRMGENNWLHLVPARRKCVFLYFYLMDREFGLMHVRLQTWLPMSIQVCLNGREYLARRLERAGIGYEKRDNCFVRIDDLRSAQRMLDDLLERDWVRFLEALARRFNPFARKNNRLRVRGYYWTFRQSEYATDVMFRDEKALAEVYPRLVRHAIDHFASAEVLRFLGRRTNARFNGQVTSDIQTRPEGVRIKHRVEENSLKMYDKQGSVLRIETTINNPERFKVRREVTRKGQLEVAWVPMRKSVADLARRVDICRAANERYLEALGVVGEPSPTRHLLDPVSRRVTRDGRAYRALRPIEAEEARLFSTLLASDFALQGFRNRTLRKRLSPETPTDDDARRKASGRVTRLLRLLRAHKLIRKVPGTFYYRITSKGHHVMTTALKLREIDLAQLAV